MPRGILTKPRAARGEFTHGTQGGYNQHGCRCDECVAASKLAHNKRTCESCGQKCTGAICLTCRRARWVKDCRMCGDTFVRPRGSFCTLTCALDYAAITRTSNERPSTDWKLAPSARKRIIAHLLERDGSSCAICRARIDLTASRRDPGMASIDHVIPRSAGGSNDMSNLRLAHLGCNSSRGNRGGYEQLALVG